MEWASVTDLNYQMRKHDHEDSCLITPLSCDFLCTVFLHFAGAPFVHPLVHGISSCKLLERALQHRSLNIKLKLFLLAGLIRCFLWPMQSKFRKKSCMQPLLFDNL